MGEDVSKGMDGAEAFSVFRPAPQGTEMIPVAEIERLLRQILREDGLSDGLIDKMFEVSRLGREHVSALRLREDELARRAVGLAEQYQPWVDAPLRLAEDEGRPMSLSDADLDRIEYAAEHGSDEPITAHSEDVLALVAEVRAWRTDPWTQDEDGVWRTPDGADFEEAAERYAPAPASLDTGRWRRMDSGKWMLPAEAGDSPVRPGLQEPEEPGHDFDPEDDFDRWRTSWRISGDGATIVTAEDLAAALRIVRANQEKP